MLLAELKHFPELLVFLLERLVVRGALVHLRDKLAQLVVLRLVGIGVDPLVDESVNSV